MKENFASNPRRKKYELWFEILNLCSNNQVHLSQIMHDLRLRTGKCKKYLTFLIQKDLLIVCRNILDQSNIIHHLKEKIW